VLQSSQVRFGFGHRRFRDLLLGLRRAQCGAGLSGLGFKLLGVDLGERLPHGHRAVEVDID